MSASITNDNRSLAQPRRLEAVRDQLAALLRQPEVAARLRSAPGETEWSALQTVGHMIEMIPYWLHHCQTIIAASEPPAFGRTLDAPERLAGPALGLTNDSELLLSRLNEEVAGAISFLEQISPAERSKTGIHIRRGEMTVDDVLERFVVSHAEEHLAQVQAALGA